MGVDPDITRAWRDMRSGDPIRSRGALGRLALSGGSDLALNKGMSYGMPGMAAYQAATSPTPEGESEALNITSPLAETLGWGVGTPFGMLGGTLIAGQVTNAARGLVGKFDSKAKKILDEEEGGASMPERVLQDSQHAVKGYSLYARGQLAHDGLEAAANYVQQYNTPQQPQQRAYHPQQQVQQYHPQQQQQYQQQYHPQQPQQGQYAPQQPQQYAPSGPPPGGHRMT